MTQEPDYAHKKKLNDIIVHKRIAAEFSRAATRHPAHRGDLVLCAAGEKKQALDTARGMGMDVPTSFVKAWRVESARDSLRGFSRVDSGLRRTLRRIDSLRRRENRRFFLRHPFAAAAAHVRDWRARRQQKKSATQLPPPAPPERQNGKPVLYLVKKG